MNGSEFIRLRQALDSLIMSGFLALRAGRVRVVWEHRNSQNGGEIVVDELPADPLGSGDGVRIANGKHALVIWAGAGEPVLPSPNQLIADGRGGWIGASCNPARWAVGRVPTEALRGLLETVQELGLLEPSYRLPATLGVAVAVPAR